MAYVKKRKKKDGRAGRKLQKPRCDKGQRYKENEFERYGFFLSMPVKERMEEFGFYTDKQFADFYKMNNATLTEWKKDERLWSIRNEHLKGMRKYTASIIAALAKKAMEQGDASEVTQWMKIIEGWTEKSGLDITSKGQSLTFSDIVKSLNSKPDAGDSQEVPE